MDETANVNIPSRTSVKFAEKLEETIDDRSIASSDDIDEDNDDDDDVASTVDADSTHENDNFLISPNWLHTKYLAKSEVEFMSENEETFWKKFIHTYLDPIDKDEKREVKG